MVANPIIKFAAVAVIIIGIMFFISDNGVSIDGSSLALGQTFENMKKVPWVFIESGTKGKVDFQRWFGFESGVSVLMGPSGNIQYNNKKEGFEYTYSPSTSTNLTQQKVIYFSRVQDGLYDFLISREVPEDAIELTEKAIKNFEEESQKVKRKVINQKGEKVEVITGKDRSGVKVEIRRSIKRNLILSVKSNDYYNTFNYPAEGPKSIYDLGAPKMPKSKMLLYLTT